MAIQVSGTQVIGNSRELTNIASVDATTATAIGAAGVGGGGPPAFDPTSTPNLTFTSSTTWTVPDLSSYSWGRGGLPRGPYARLITLFHTYCYRSRRSKCH